jgi:predicted peptidase
MLTRREALRFLGAAGASFAAQSHLSVARAWAAAKEGATPALAAGAPQSAQRIALIEAFQKESDGLEKKFEARTFKGDWAMPYRLFRPEGSGKMPLVVYLHGSGGQGDDNEKQLALGNVFGTRVWLLPRNQKANPCYVLAPQSNHGWVRYDPEKWAKGEAEMVPGPGQATGVVLALIDALRKEFAIDDTRIYVTGQSMGGAGTWNIVSSRPNFFAAAVICCGSRSFDDGTGSIDTPVWAFHGDADQTVPMSMSRDRIAARKKAGGHPLYTEYAGVDHNVWEWVYTEPEVVKWVFEQKRG